MKQVMGKVFRPTPSKKLSLLILIDIAIVEVRPITATIHFTITSAITEASTIKYPVNITSKDTFLLVVFLAKPTIFFYIPVLSKSKYSFWQNPQYQCSLWHYSKKSILRKKNIEKTEIEIIIAFFSLNFF